MCKNAVDVKSIQLDTPAPRRFPGIHTPFIEIRHRSLVPRKVGLRAILQETALEHKTGDSSFHKQQRWRADTEVRGKPVRLLKGKGEEGDTIL